MVKLNDAKKFVNYFIKPGKSILVNAKMKTPENFSCSLATELVETVGKGGKVVKEKAFTKQALADIGETSLWIEDHLRKLYPEAKAESSLIFGDLKSVERVMTRPKGALSIETKLERELPKVVSGDVCTSFKQAVSVIGDGIGSRVITQTLDKLSKKEIDNMISKMLVDGESLTYKQKDLLTRYIYQKPIKPRDREQAFKLFETFSQPLIEKRSKEVVDQLTLGILKERMLTEGLDIQQIKAKGLFDDNLIERLIKDDGILPIKIEMINNYRGKHGLAEFSNNQIRQLADALNYKRTDGKLVKIYSDPRGLNRYNYPLEEVEKQAKKSIKASGYRTAQMNIKHANGALGEIQFRGKYTNMIGEYEHIAYDLRMGKNTLGANFDEFKKAISKLSDAEYSKYNEYLEECYNYYNRLELGLPAIKPNFQPDSIRF